jgi:hypothetical protein
LSSSRNAFGLASQIANESARPIGHTRILPKSRRGAEHRFRYDDQGVWLDGLSGRIFRSAGFARHSRRISRTLRRPELIMVFQRMD